MFNSEFINYKNDELWELNPDQKELLNPPENRTDDRGIIKTLQKILQH